MNENQNVKTKENWREKIDELVDAWQPSVQLRIWRVINALSLEHQLNGDLKFPVPHQRISKFKVDESDLLPVLSNLHRHSILKVEGGYMFTNPEDGMEQRWIETNIIDDPHILRDPETKIVLNPPKFAYLIQKLQKQDTVRRKTDPELQKQELLSYVTRLRPEAQQKLWLIVDALHFEYELHGSPTFDLPAHRFKSTGLEEHERLALLKNLHNRDIVAMVWPEGDTPFETDITQDDRVFTYWGGSVVRIDESKFLHLYTELQKIIQANQSDRDPQPETTSQPYCFEEKGKGYIKFGKNGRKIEIGRTTTRPYRFLQFLLRASLGTRSTLESVFDAVRLPRDKDDPALNHPDALQRNIRMQSIIENSCIKGLQKLVGTKLKFGRDNRYYWLELKGK